MQLLRFFVHRGFHAIKAVTTSPIFNVAMFSAFWALQLFSAKLGFLAGVKVLPFQIIAILTALGCLLVLIFPRSGAKFSALFKERPKLFWQLFFANGIQAGLGTLLSMIGIALTAAINAGFLVKLATVTTILFAWLILNERISRLKIGALISMLGGAYLLTTKGQALLPKVGDACILGACVCWSLGNILVKKTLSTGSVAADAITLQKPLAGLLVFLSVLGASLVKPDWFEILGGFNLEMRLLPYALISGLCLGITWIYLYRTLEVSSASYMTLMSMMTPVIISLLAILFLDERLIPIQITGAGIIVFSGILVAASDIVHP